jgi:hypothetical protein
MGGWEVTDPALLLSRMVALTTGLHPGHVTGAYHAALTIGLLVPGCEYRLCIEPVKGDLLPAAPGPQHRQRIFMLPQRRKRG